MGTFADAVPSITAWCFGLAFAWIVAYTVCRMTSAFKEKPALAAINFVHMVPIVALCYHGVVGYRALPGTLEERMYDYDASAYEICVVQIALQLFITASALGTRDKDERSACTRSRHVSRESENVVSSSSRARSSPGERGPASADAVARRSEVS